jgi:RibD C-terminal domain
LCRTGESFKRVVVLSSRPVDLSAARGGMVEQMSGAPAEILSKLAASGAQHLYVDGGITIQRFLRAGLVQRLIITRVPVLIGEGIPLFGTLPRDVRLRHVATEHFCDRPGEERVSGYGLTIQALLASCHFQGVREGCVWGVPTIFCQLLANSVSLVDVKSVRNHFSANPTSQELTN